MDNLRLLRMVGAYLVFGFATVFSSAQTVTTLVALSSAMGAAPQAALVQGIDGNFYGTARYGGAYGSGSVFRVTPNGEVKVLYSFCAQQNCADGQSPIAALVQARDGNFYGTTSSGGAASMGTVFKMGPAGKLTTLYSFCAQLGCTDGNFPDGALIQGRDGNFYGETANGGAFGGGCGSYGCGTLFKITGSGGLTTLYTFCKQPNDNCTDGELPGGGLIQASDGNFYGTTLIDGNSDTCSIGCGTFFRFSPAGVLTTLYTFCSQQNCADGASPTSGVIEGNDKSFYGTTNGGGISSCNGGCGTAFKISPRGKWTMLHSFDSTDGAEAWGGLVQGTDGNFYGTTLSGGVNNNCFGTCGTVFEMNSSGVVTSLYNFCPQANCADGDNPEAGLVQGTDGRFYGTTYQGGVDSFACTFGCGTVFSLNVGLESFVETRPTSGVVKTKIAILGNNLTGTTRVTFNGTTAAFTVVSNTEITAVVPERATTGKVKVMAPGATLSSNVPFLVAPQIVSFSPASGAVGTVVTVKGQSLTGARAVSFGGVLATSFTVESNTQITATVPTGAKSGVIGARTAGGRTQSTSGFTVTR